MRKNIASVVTVLSLSLFLTACQEQKAPQKTQAPKPVVGVVDTGRVYSESKAGKAGSDYLEKIQVAMQDELISMQEAMQKDPSEANMASFQQKYAGFQQRINLEQEQVVTKLNDALQNALDSYRDTAGLAVIIPAETVMSLSPSADVTAHIVDALNKIDVTFEPIILPEPVAPVSEAPSEEAPAEKAPTEAETPAAQ